MATMLTNVNLSACRRPVYTTYELSESVKNKRNESGKSREEFADLHHINVKVLEQIEEGERSFTPQLYKACSYILNISLDDLIAVEEDEAPSFRASNDSAEVRSTFEKANYIFDEIIMQKKISARAYRQVEII